MNYDLDTYFTLVKELVASAGDGWVHPDDVDEALDFLEWAEFYIKIDELHDRLQARGYPLELPAEREEEE